MKKTKTREIVEVAACTMVLAVITGFIWGSLGAALIGGAIYLVIMLFAHMSVAHDKQLRQAHAATKAEMFDWMTEAGMKIERDGKPWSKGCRIDPETHATIEPSVQR